jgi:hypothetical protein
MAIDMIEQYESGLFTEGRLGRSNFADEAFKNYTGGEEFFNLFGSRKKKKSAFREAIRTKYADLKTDCLNIQRSIDLVNNDLQTLLKKKADLQQREQLDETNLVLGELKNLQISQDCEARLSALTKQQERDSTIRDIQQLTESSVGKTQQELSGLGNQLTGGTGGGLAANKNLLIYGGIGIAAIVILALIIKSRR